jgi:hypothetical protein
MVTMSMGDQGSFDGFPGIDVDISLRAVDAVIGKFK